MRQKLISVWEMKLTTGEHICGMNAQCISKMSPLHSAWTFYNYSDDGAKLLLIIGRRQHSQHFRKQKFVAVSGVADVLNHTPQKLLFTVEL